MAATMSKNLKNISSLKREEGRQVLREELGWEPFEDEDEPQKSIHLDCLFDHLMFMVHKGFQWNEISLLFNLVQETLHECRGHTVHDTIKYFTCKLQALRGCLSESTITRFSEFFFTTYMRHFKLYQFVFTKPQEKLVVNTDVSVGIPPDPVPPFTDAKDLDVYDYEKKYQELEEHEEKRQEQHKQLLDEVKKQAEEDVSKPLASLEGSTLNREELVKLIHTVASAHISAASNTINTQITNTMEDLDIMLEKTSLPRPSALGQPPRYKSRTPIPSSGSKRQANSREALQPSKSRQSSRHGKR